MFCDNVTNNDNLFCSEHMHFESGRIIQTLYQIGSKVDQKCKSYHLAAGLTRKVMKTEAAKKTYQYCPSSEGLLPAWLESVDHLIRWLRVCYKVYEHPQRNSNSRFPFHLFMEEFPDIQDIDDNTYFHGFWATYDSIRAYGLNKKIPWERHTPTLLPFLGGMQGFLPYHKAIASEKFQGDDFEWHTGIQDHTYAKDIFEVGANEDEDRMVAPALRLRPDLDGTASPSYEGMEDIKPEVSFSYNIRGKFS